MKTFSWKVRPGMRTEREPRVQTIRFGDGYEQRRADGINGVQSRYSIMLSGPHATMQAVDDFLSQHGGVSAFLWQPPGQPAPAIFICRRWSAVRMAKRTEITGEFERVPA
ncbi:phage tail protein [Pantoea sp. GL120224-02]|uniref:phage tail protein n=1 Tax=Pantoea sp. GL120224-02 TaxID=1378084 RepID=UPI000BCFD892|nr:phage tail protein [Pantoea sp. GL120224-02]SNY70875.1 Phage-related protein [Pantoea sp. GL120224-02]